jgi:hypothetical protein
MKFFSRRIIYVQVHQDHFLARIVGGDKTIRRQCYALGNKKRPVSDFDKIRSCLKLLFKELSPGFSILKPWALLHFVPNCYTVSQPELAGFKRAAERAGVGFCYLSKWETPHTDKELLPLFQ